MTRQKHFKQRVRERMRKTGETYAQAREALEAEREAAGAPRPRGPISGVVRDAAGAPVAGAGVQLARRYRWEPDPAEEVMGWGWSSRSAVETDAAGAFELPAPEPKGLLEVGLVVVAPGRAALVRRLPADQRARPLDLRLPAGPGQVVRGRVVEAATGAALPGLVVGLSLDGLALAGLVDGQGPAEPAAEVPFGGGVEVVTDADGRFQADGLPAFGGGQVVVERQARWARARVDLPAGRPCLVELRLEPSATLVVRVVDDRGRPVVGARVDAWPGSVGGGRMWHEGPRTGADGTCRLARDAGDHAVGVVAPAPGPWSVDAPDLLERVVLTTGAERTLELRLAARPGGAVECRVRWSGSGEAAAGVEVDLSAAGAGNWLAARRVTTAADGRARFEGLQPGRYHLQASGSASAPPLATVEVGAAPVAVELEVLAPRALRVRVVDPAGRPVPGASVRCHAEDGAQTGARTDAAGWATLAVRRERVSVGVEARGFARGYARPAADDDEALITLAAARTLTLLARVDPSLEGARVRYDVRSGGSWRQNGDAAPVGPAGVVRLVLDDVPPGPGRVALRVGAAVPVAVDVGPEDAALDLGRVALGPGLTLRALVLGSRWSSDDPPHVVVRTPDLGGVHGEVAPDRRLVVEGLPPGPARLEVSVAPSTLGGRWWIARVPLDAEALTRGELPPITLEEVAAADLPRDDD